MRDLDAGGGAAARHRGDLPGVQPRPRALGSPRTSSSATEPADATRARRLPRLLAPEGGGARREPRAADRRRAGAVWSLTVAEQQLVEIAKALALDARLIVMDEPSARHRRGRARAALRRDRAPARGGRRRRLHLAPTRRGVRGSPTGSRCCATAASSGRSRSRETTRDEIIRLMVGRELSDEFRSCAPVRRAERAGRWRVRGLRARGGFCAASTFDRARRRDRRRRRADRQRAARARPRGLRRRRGSRPARSSVDGRPAQPSRPHRGDPRRASRSIPEDRKAQGLLLGADRARAT